MTSPASRNGDAAAPEGGGGGGLKGAAPLKDGGSWGWGPGGGVPGVGGGSPGKGEGGRGAGSGGAVTLSNASEKK